MLTSNQVISIAVMVITIVGVLFAIAGLLASMGAPALVVMKPISEIVFAAGALFTASGLSIGFN